MLLCNWVNYLNISQTWSKIERKQFSELLFQYAVGGEGDEDSGATPTDAARLLRVYSSTWRRL